MTFQVRHQSHAGQDIISVDLYCIDYKKITNAVGRNDFVYSVF